jgi:hypothetical protein
MIETEALFIEHIHDEDLQQHPFAQLQLVLPLVVPASLVLLQLAAPDTVPSMWPQ